MARTSVSVVLVRPLVAVLRPTDLPTFFAATDLTPQMLGDAEARVSAAQFCVAWAEAIRLSADPALALRIAEVTVPGTFGVVEYVCICAPSVGHALRQWVRYLGILDSTVEVGLIEAGASARVRVLEESEAPAPAAHELCFALLYTRAKMAVGPLDVEVCFSHRANSAGLARYRALFGPRVRFGAQHTELVFDRASLDLPLATSDPNLHGILVPTAEAARDKAAPEALLTDQVRRALRAAITHDEAQLELVARRLGLTGRSLQRRLRDEGTAYQEIRDGMRRELADRYLGEGKSLAEISFLLGFSEPSAFFRAFKRWTGLTPLEQRARLLAT